jgi:hypothetical protein
MADSRPLSAIARYLADAPLPPASTPPNRPPTSSVSNAAPSTATWTRRLSAFVSALPNPLPHRPEATLRLGTASGVLGRIPLRYELDDNLRPIGEGEYMDPEAAAAGTAAVANQGVDRPLDDPPARQASCRLPKCIVRLPVPLASSVIFPAQGRLLGLSTVYLLRTAAGVGQPAPLRMSHRSKDGQYLCVC